MPNISEHDRNFDLLEGLFRKKAHVIDVQYNTGRSTQPLQEKVDLQIQQLLEGKPVTK